MLYTKLRIFIFAVSTLFWTVFIFDLIDIGSFASMSGFLDAHPFVKIMAFIQTQTIGLRLSALSVIVLVRFNQFHKLFSKDWENQRTVTVLQSKKTTLRTFVLLACTCGLRFGTEIGLLLLDPSPTTTFATFILNARFVRIYYAVFRFIGAVTAYSMDAIFAFFAHVTLCEEKSLLINTNLVLNGGNLDSDNAQRSNDVWLLFRSYFMFIKNLRVRRELFRIVLLIQVAGSILELMSAISWFAMFAFSTDLSVDVNLITLRRILNGSWTLFVIIPIQFYLLFRTAVEISRQHQVLLAKFGKLAFLRKVEASLAYNEQNKSALRLLLTLKDSQRPYGFSIGGLTDINIKVFSMLLVCLFGYLTFALDRMENAHSYIGHGDVD